MKIMIKIGHVELEAELNDTPTAREVAKILPLKTSKLVDIHSLEGANLADIGVFGLDFVMGSSPLGFVFSLNIMLTLLVGLLYLSWLASWWVQKTNTNGRPSK